MKALAIVAALAGIAHADSKAEIEKTLRSTVVDHGFMGVRVFGPDGKELDGMAASQLVFGKSPKVGKITVGFSAERDTLAWFEAPLTLDHETLRLTGVAHVDHGWDIVLVSVSKVIPDKDLIAAGKQAAQAMPAKALEGEDTVGRVAYWVSHGFTGQGASAGVAAGTAPAEYAVGAATGKLVAGWDKLKMVPTAGDVDTVDTYLSLVRLHVMMPIKGTKLGVPLVLTAIVDSDGTYWQWQSLQFSPAL